MLRFFHILLLACITLTLSLPADGADIRNVRVWADPDKTRAVLDLSGPVEYKLFTLDNPHRLVVDIQGSIVAGQLDLPSSKYRGVVSNIRHAKRGGEDLRVVLDLAQDTRPKSFLLEPAGDYGHRLVVDLFPAASSKPTVRTVNDIQRVEHRDVVVLIFNKIEIALSEHSLLEINRVVAQLNPSLTHHAYVH